MSWYFYTTMVIFLIAIVMLYRMRRMSLEKRKLRYEVEISQSSPASLEAWRAASEASLNASRARRGIINEEEDYGGIA